MFRLIKLAMYAFVGYALYQLYQGIMQQPQGGGGGRFAASRTQDYDAGLSDQTRTGQNLTGAGMGQAEETLDNDGGSVRHNVGRGVIST
jgi:hypothetical protein